MGGAVAAAVKLVASGLPLLATDGERAGGGKKDDKKNKKGKPRGSVASITGPRTSTVRPSKITSAGLAAREHTTAT